MQAIQLTPNEGWYTSGMKTGRPSKRERTPFETRLHAARETAGLSQAQVAAKLGITQSAYAFWERRKVALRPEQIEQVAKILGVTAEHLFGASEVPRQGPTGKARQLFERVSKLPRSTQQRILANVEDALTAHEVRKAS